MNQPQQDKPLNAHKTLINNIHCSLPYFMHKNVIKAMEEYKNQQVAIAVAERYEETERHIDDLNKAMAEKDAVIAAFDEEIKALKEYLNEARQYKPVYIECSGSVSV